jgi:hypothetical protein
MRFRVVSLAAGAAVLALSAGGALAIVAGNLDQHQDTADAASAWDAGDYPTAQTFTAGMSDSLDRVSLNGSSANSGGTLTVRIETVDGSGNPTGTLVSPGATTTTSTASGWFDADFSTGPSIAAGTKYAIVFGNMGYFMAAGTCTAGSYSQGAAIAAIHSVWAPISGMEPCNIAQFAFRTYVATAQTAKLQWDKTQVTAGETTPLTLTETFTFAENAVPTSVNQAAGQIVGAGWSVQQVALPGWFTVAHIACSAQIATADCIPANLTAGSSIPLTPDGNPVIVTLTGTASPSASAGGTTASATAKGCVTPVVLNPVPTCVSDAATVAVGAFAITPAPTTAATNAPVGDSAPPLALLACIALGVLGVMTVAAQRARARR